MHRFDNIFELVKLSSMANKTKTSDSKYVTRKDLKHEFKEFRVVINEDIKTHMGALFEKFSDDVGLLAEQHQDTNKRVRNLEIKTSSLEEKMEMVIDVVGEVKVTVNEIKDTLKTKTDFKEHKLLEHRVIALESKI